MSEKEETSPDFPWLPLITLIVAGSGVALLLPQITSSRPGGGDPILVDTFDPQTINARLWQDPVGVVNAEQEKRKQSQQDDTTHSIEAFRHLFIEKSLPELTVSPLTRERQTADWLQRFKSLNICVVMIPGGPYVEEVERRVRARRAVIEALGQVGYVPEKDHELGYVRLPWRPLAQNAAQCILMLEEDRRRYTKPPPSEKVVWRSEEPPQSPSLLLPYEWYETEGFGLQENQKDHLLLLWLNDDALVDAPLARLADLISRLGFESIGKTATTIFPRYDYVFPPQRVVVLGPDNSGTLRNMVLEASDALWNAETKHLLAKTHIYSSQAAAADELLMTGVKHDFPNCKYFIENAIRYGQTDNDFTIERTLPLDDKIVTALWGEIDKRGMRSTDHVAIISELDTYYARALSQSFISVPRDKSSANVVDAYTYIRGIDGKLPSDEKEKASNGTVPKSDDKTQPPSRPTEETEGLNRADDIRRLAKELRERDNELRSKNEGRLGAVGLLGSDVYDKLELLRALRPELPEAVFFTNNVEARLVHPDEWSETHNLIVASPFALSLKGYDKVAPFRDSGQSSLFAATLEAFGKDVPLPAIPLIFEVDHNGFKELKTPERAGAERAMMYLTLASVVVIVVSLVLWISLVTRVNKEKVRKPSVPNSIPKRGLI
jgi:hypothetical protein